MLYVAVFRGQWLDTKHLRINWDSKKKNRHGASGDFVRVAQKCALADAKTKLKNLVAC